MRRQRAIKWLIFGVCALVVLEVLAWVSVQTLRLEAREAEARREAEQNQRLRLALWRMESAVVGLLAGEAARPPAHYRAFPAGEGAGPSPLLIETPAFIRMHFELRRSGEVRSPQAPAGAERRRAVEAGFVEPEPLAARHGRLLEIEQMIARQGLDGSGEAEAGEAEAQEPAPEVASEGADGAALEDDIEFLARRQAVREAIGIDEPGESRQADEPEEAAEADEREEAGEAFAGRAADLAEAPVRRGIAGDVAGWDGVEAVGPLRPLWKRDPASGRPELLFVRSVRGSRGERVQGFWVDWPALRDELLARVVDVLPNARLQPLDDPLVVPAQDGRRVLVSQRLASIPARLIPSALAPARTNGLSPIRITLLIAWLAVLASIAAIGVVLHRSMALSERRGRFVGAVTHELRTPLTSFQLYTRLLEQAGDEEKRRRYVQTLSEQADRLGRIVENVLAFARLERGGRPGAAGSAPAGEVLDAVLGSAAARAEAAGMEPSVRIEDAVRGATIPDARDAIERIVANLVDNAARYAEGPDRRLELAARLEGRRVVVRVRDFGPGVEPSARARIFRPFEQAAERPEAGLGLGLALSRQIARDLRGDLRLADVRGPGAAFELTLPAR